MFTEILDGPRTYTINLQRVNYISSNDHSFSIVISYIDSENQQVIDFEDEIYYKHAVATISRDCGLV